MTTPSRAAVNARLHPYFSAVLAVAVAALARMLLQPILGYGLPFITFFGAVFLIAWWLGLRPALLAVGLSAIAAGLLFFPAGSSPEERLLTAVGLALFMAIGVGAAAMGEGRLRAQRRAQREADEARLARIAAEDAAVEAEMAAERRRWPPSRPAGWRPLSTRPTMRSSAKMWTARCGAGIQRPSASSATRRPKWWGSRCSG